MKKDKTTPVGHAVGDPTGVVLYPSSGNFISPPSL